MEFLNEGVDDEPFEEGRVKNIDPRLTLSVREILKRGHTVALGSGVGVNCGIMRRDEVDWGRRGRAVMFGVAGACSMDLAAISRLCEVSIEKMAKFTCERLNPAPSIEPE